MKIIKLPTETFYQIRDPKNFFSAMRADVTLLRSNGAYVSMTTILVCCLDAIAADSGKATKGKFEVFVTKHFPDLCRELESASPGKKGAAILYCFFRNGFAHLRGPGSKFAICEDHELEGAWASPIEIEGAGKFVGLNVDRLAHEFLTLMDRLEKRSAESVT